MAYVFKNLRVSVVIRTRNMEKHFRCLLEKLSRQTLNPSEIIIVNNFSSKEELKGFSDALSNFREKYFDNQIPIKLIPVSDSEFSHPYSTNLGVRAAHNELVCITNGHALPTSAFWLANGIKHFRDPRVAGVSAYFVANEDGSVWEKLVHGLLWSNFKETSKAYIKDGYFSTINCIIRKSLWMKYPFEENLPHGGEDHDWAQEMIARGYKIVVEPKFNVHHSHGYTLPEIITTNLAWYRIRKRIGSFERPRKSYTRLKRPSMYV